MDVCNPPHSPRRAKRLAWSGLLLACAALLLAAVSGFGHRAGLWSFVTGFAVLGVAALAGLAALVVSVVAAVRMWLHRPRPPLSVATFGGVLGAMVVGLPVNQLHSGMTLPRIHDITTDTANPPAFVALAPKRADAPNPAAYPGEPVARLQLAGYPQIVPHYYKPNAKVVFNEALEIVRRRGWAIAEAEPDEGCIEASETSQWFGFVDDVVVRIADTPRGTRVDVRSRSRVGMSDFGANAKRIEAFLSDLDRELSE